MMEETLIVFKTDSESKLGPYFFFRTPYQSSPSDVSEILMSFFSVSNSSELIIFSAEVALGLE